MARLSLNDFADLKEALLDAFDTREKLEQLAFAARNVTLDRLAFGENLDQLVDRLIRRAQSDQWLPSLVGTAFRLGQNNEALQNLRVEWESGDLLKQGDPYKALMLPGKMVLIDRVCLRTHLATLERLDGSRVLVVDGADKSGQTFSIHYISYLSAVRETFSSVYIDLQTAPKNESNQVDALTVGNAISMALLGETHPAPEDKNLQTWIDNKYCPWLASSLARDRLKTGRGTDWVVIDHFRKVSAHSSAFDLVAALSMRTYRDLHTLRLVLLSYHDHEWLQARVVGKVEFEKIPVIDRKQLVRFFSDLHRDQVNRRGEEVDHEALVKRVITSVRRVETGLPAEGVCALERMGRATWDEVERVLRVSETNDADDKVFEAALAGLERAEPVADKNAGGDHVAGK